MLVTENGRIYLVLVVLVTELSESEIPHVSDRIHIKFLMLVSCLDLKFHIY